MGLRRETTVIKGHEDYTKNSDERLIASAQSCKKTDRRIEKQEANNGKGNNWMSISKKEIERNEDETTVMKWTSDTLPPKKTPDFY